MFIIRRSVLGRLLGATFMVGLSSGCRLDMHDQPRYEALEASQLWEDGRSSRSPVKGTVARGRLRVEQQPYYTGKDEEGNDLQTLPEAIEVTEAFLVRGQTRYNVFCSPCHGYNGYANGMIVQRGFQSPPSFHVSRLREGGIGHFYDVITNGYGAMYAYGASIPPDDRWAISAYIRVLQLSQFTMAKDLAPEERSKVDEGIIEDHLTDYGAAGHLAVEAEKLGVSGYRFEPDSHGEDGHDDDGHGTGSSHGSGHGAAEGHGENSGHE